MDVVLRLFHPAFADELNDAGQLIMIEPDPVAPAHVDNDARDRRELAAVHDDPALRAFHVKGAVPRHGRFANRIIRRF